MKVLYITPNGVGNSSPQIEMSKLIRGRFESLDLYVPGVMKPPELKDWDVVFSAMEATARIGFNYASKLGVPYYSHWEWIPPFRIWGYGGGDDPLNWGYREEHKRALFRNKNLYNKYKDILEASEQATISSCASSSFLDIAESFIGRPIVNNFIKFPTSCFNLAEKRYAKSNYFVTVSRLVPNKRVLEIAKAVRMSSTKLTWVIIGAGNERIEIEKVLAGSDTKVEFVGAINGDRKFKIVGESRFQLAAWHGLPQLEAAYLGTPTINIRIKEIEELYGDTLVWADSVDDMADKISNSHNNNYYNDNVSKVISGLPDLNINTKDDGADIIEEALRSIAR